MPPFHNLFHILLDDCFKYIDQEHTWDKRKSYVREFLLINHEFMKLRVEECHVLKPPQFCHGFQMREAAYLGHPVQFLGSWPAPGSASATASASVPATRFGGKNGGDELMPR